MNSDKDTNMNSDKDNFILVCHLVIKAQLTKTAAITLLQQFEYTPEEYNEKVAILNTLYGNLKIDFLTPAEIAKN